MYVPQLNAGYYGQENGGNHESYGRTNKSFIKRYLVIFVLLFACVSFGLLSLRFALNVENGNAMFVVRTWLFIIFLVVAQIIAVLAGC